MSDSSKVKKLESIGNFESIPDGIKRTQVPLRAIDGHERNFPPCDKISKKDWQNKKVVFPSIFQGLRHSIQESYPHLLRACVLGGIVLDAQSFEIKVEAIGHQELDEAFEVLVPTESHQLTFRITLFNRKRRTSATEKTP